MSLIKKIRINSVSIHRLLAWLGAGILLIYTLSAMTHPLLSWTGPKAAAFFPPTAVIENKHLQAIPIIIKRHRLTQAKIIKVIPSKDMPVLQVTEADENRRYFDLTSYDEKFNYDQQQALWLAQYYLGQEDIPEVISINKQDYFDNQYPWVNRLLPVYKITLDDASKTTLYIYTELNALASMTNSWKTSLQTVFQVLHTWNFLDDVDNARVLLLSILLLTLIAFVLSGIGLVFSFKSRKIIQNSRRWHRRIAYIIWFPLLGLSVSGFYHLLQSAYVENTSGLKLTQTIDLTKYDVDSFSSLEDTELKDLGLLNQVSMTIDKNNQLLYRVSLSQKLFGKNTSLNATVDEHAHHQATSSEVSREQKYRGKATERGGLYFTVEDGKPSLVDDKKIAATVAINYLQESRKAVKDVKKVTHFGPNYDFRNKRLPVWKVDFSNKKGDTLFIDPTIGVVVDHTTKISRYERYSFSFLHKWNFLVPLIGRKNRDIVVSVILLMILAASITGIFMLLSRKRNHN